MAMALKRRGLFGLQDLSRVVPARMQHQGERLFSEQCAACELRESIRRKKSYDSQGSLLRRLLEQDASCEAPCNKAPHDPGESPLPALGGLHLLAAAGCQKVLLEPPPRLGGSNRLTGEEGSTYGQQCSCPRGR